MSIFTSTLALLRHLRVERGMALLLVIIVAFTAFVMAAIPRLYNQTLDEELQHRVTEAPADWRNISITMLRRTAVSDDETILDRLSTGSLAYFLELPATLQEIISGFGYFIESQKSPVLQTRNQPRLDIRRSLQFRFQGDIDQHIALIDGRWAEPRQPVFFSELTATPGARGETPIPFYEVAVSETSLKDLAYERRQLLTVRLNGTGQRSLVQITGVFSINDPDEEFWNADRRLDEPVIAGFGTDFDEIVEAVAMPHLDVYEDLRNRGGGANPWLNEWTYFVDPEQLTLENYPLVAGEIRQMKVTLGPIDQLSRPEEHYLASTSPQLQLVQQQSGPGGAEVHNELPLIVDRFAGQARLTSSVIALATIGILGVGLAALGLLAALIADRRRGIVTLLRSRGAGKIQLTLARLVEGLLLCLPGTLVGLIAATLVVDSRSNPWSFRAAIATGLLTVVLLLASAGGNILPRLGSLLGGRANLPGGVSFRRLMIEGLVIVLAAVGIFILRQRGLEPDTDTEGLGGFDPFLTAVPVLLALSAGIALLRLYPYPVRALAWFARWMRGTVIFMGLRRLAYQSTAANLPLLVLLLAVGVSVFTSVVAHSVDRARIDATWTEVRADYRLDILPGFGAALPNLDLSNASGAEGQARELRTRDAMLSVEGLENPSSFQGSSSNIPPFTLIATETNAYQEIIAGSAIEYEFPDELLTPNVSLGIGTADNPAPALLTSTWPEEAGDRPEPGTLLHFWVLSDQISGTVSVFVEIVDIGADYPGVNPNTPLVLMRWDTFVAAMEPQHPREVRPTTIYMGGSGLDQASLEAEIVVQSAELPIASAGRDVPLGIGITSRSALLEDLRDAPIARGLTNSFRLSIALAAIYGGLVVVVALVLTARERSRDLGYLRTLGLDSRQALGMTLTETVPGVLLACGLGVPLGIAIARLIEPGLDLQAFVGPEVPIAVLVDRPTAIAIAAGLALVSLVSVALFSLLARRVQLGEVLRVGE